MDWSALIIPTLNVIAAAIVAALKGTLFQAPEERLKELLDLYAKLMEAKKNNTGIGAIDGTVNYVKAQIEKQCEAVLSADKKRAKSVKDIITEAWPQLLVLAVGILLYIFGSIFMCVLLWAVGSVVMMVGLIWFALSA